jgi:hypothetical protein
MIERENTARWKSKTFETTMVSCEELLKMLSSTTKTLKQQLTKDTKR